MTVAVLKRVFKEKRYSTVALFVSLVVVLISLLFPNWSVVEQVLFSSLSFGSKLSFLFGAMFANSGVFSGSLVVMTAFLFGVNVALLVYYVRRRQSKNNSVKMRVANIGGMVSAVLGVGCAACGSVIVTATLGLLGAGGLILYLPLHGAEFSLVGVFALFFSIRYLIGRIDDPLVCPVE